MIIDDPEIIQGFCEETRELITELDDLLGELEDDPSQSQHFEKFGQIIDRAMGAAETIGLEKISKFCEMGKIIGYKSSQVTDESLRTIVIAVLFDTLDFLSKMLKALEKGEESQLKSFSSDAFVKRLHWLAEKFKGIDRASCEIESEKVESQEDLDDLLDSLGL